MSGTEFIEVVLFSLQPWSSLIGRSLSLSLSVRRGSDGEGRPRQQCDGVRSAGQQSGVRGHAGSVRLPWRALPAHGHAQPVAPQHQPQQQLQQRRERRAHMTRTPWPHPGESWSFILGTTTCCDSKPRPYHLDDHRCRRLVETDWDWWRLGGGGAASTGGTAVGNVVSLHQSILGNTWLTTADDGQSDARVTSYLIRCNLTLRAPTANQNLRRSVSPKHIVNTSRAKLWDGDMEGGGAQVADSACSVSVSPLRYDSVNSFAFTRFFNVKISRCKR